MRDVSEQLAAMLDEGSRQVTWEVNITRGARVETGLPVVLDGAPTWNASQQVELSGKVRLPIQDPTGRSWIPEHAGDLLAPFGSEVDLLCSVTAGHVSEKVQVGRLRIHKVPSARAERLRFGGEWVTFAEVISLDLRDRMTVLHSDEFDTPTRVRHPGSAWAELAHLSPFPVVRDGDDVTLPSGLTYDGTVAEAAQEVARRLGGVAAFDSTGNLVVRRTSDETALALRLGDGGTVASVGSVMDSEGVYNRVVVRGKAPSGALIVAVREAEGDLAPSVWGRHTYTADQGEFISTQQQADDYADRLLARVSSPRAAELEVQCLLDPRLELGDVASVAYEGRLERLRAAKISYGDTMMTVTGARL